MLLANRMQADGDFLFRWRSFLPLILLPLALVAVGYYGHQLETRFGKPFEDGWEFFSIVVAASGAILRAVTVGWVPNGTSGRNTRSQRADTLNTTGMYSVVRNPLYLGNFLVLLGFSLATQVWWFALLTSLAFLFYYERIILREEAFLVERFGAQYTNWASRTPAFLPDPRLWRAPSLPFSLRMVLRREYNGFYLLVVVFTVLEFSHDLAVGGLSLAWRPDWSLWLGVFGFATAAWLVLRNLKRRSRMLVVAGR